MFDDGMGLANALAWANAQLIGDGVDGIELRFGVPIRRRNI
jgi:hypothetical protein